MVKKINHGHIPPNIFLASSCRRFLISTIILFSSLFFLNITPATANSWQELQDSYKHSARPEKINNIKPDPWLQLRAVYLPFTEKEEIQASKDSGIKSRLAGKFAKVLISYQGIIAEAAHMFNIPEEIIAAVIMVESGGNANAKAKTSTASGLMQTIKATFSEARNGLMKQNIQINESPFTPRSSILAGCWYLDKMYKTAKQDNQIPINDRKNIASWKLPLEYYYAGPGNGQKKENIIIIYSGGRRVLIDKPAYSQKVMNWARIMGGNTPHS